MENRTEKAYSVEQIVAMTAEEFQKKISPLAIRSCAEAELRDYVDSKTRPEIERIKQVSHSYLQSSSNAVRDLGILNQQAPTKKDFVVLDFISAMVIQKKIDPHWYERLNPYY